jgi:5,10-methylenetetrahydrofolate reductase
VDRLAEVGTDRVPFSVEFYPPRDEPAEARLWRAARVFEQLRPVFVSGTYGAGGSTRDRTVRRQAELSGAQIPLPLLERLTEAAGTGPEENRDEVRKIGIELATEMSARLLAEGVPCRHFCTLNFAKATTEVLANLGVSVLA